MGVTIIFAFILIVICLALLGLGWLITGKSKIQRGACGRNPHEQKGDTDCSRQVCTLCEDEKKNHKSK